MGGASDTPQLKGVILLYPFQIVSRLDIQLRMTTFSIKLCEIITRCKRISLDLELF